MNREPSVREPYLFNLGYIVPGSTTPTMLEQTYNGIPGCNPTIFFICTHCGNHWATRLHIQVEGEESPFRFSPIPRRCPPCGDGHLVDTHEPLADLPRAVLINELEAPYYGF